MRVTLSYEMMTGRMERQFGTSSEAIEALLSLEGTGASSVALDLERPLAPPVSLGGKIDPSSHSISLADARRPDCPLIYVNRGFELLTGYTQDDCRGRNCRFLQGAETSSAALGAVRRACESGTPLLIDLLNYRKDGSTFWNRLSLKPVRNAQGDLTHIVGIQSDITRMLSLQAEVEAWAMDLGTASHSAF